MDTSNSANTLLLERDDGRLRGKSSRTSQQSLSKGMAEALYQPHTLTQPKPQASRVKDAGRDFLKHNQTCQWIQFIQEQTGPMDDKKSKRPVRAAPENESSHEVKDSGSETQELPERPPSPSYEEQLKILQKQQVELQEQQRRLEEQLNLQRKTRQILSGEEFHPRHEEPEIVEPKCPPTIVESSSRPIAEEQKAPNVAAPARFRRRLKGSVAQSFAERDEGSIGSLLYNQKVSEPPGDRKTSDDHNGNGMKPAHDGRHYVTSRNSGSTISQLLVQLPCVSSFDISKVASDCSATITDTITTDLTIKEKDGHQDC